ncbi:MAG TPA: SemiSWEET transporter [Flavobacterium sp.]
MDYIEIIGLAAAFFTTVANIPQTYTIIKEKSTESISILTYSSLVLGCGLWLVYGILQNDIPIIIGNAIAFATAVIILFLKLASQRVLNRIHDKVIK